ncbi:MAG: hypothetical protein AAF901_08075 [Bacteroidota bacterium]
MKIRINSFFLQKNTIVLFFLALFVFSCTVNEKPEFVGIEKITVLDANLKTVTLSADAIFNNPNDVGGTLSIDELNVLVNDANVVRFTSEEFKVPSKDHFNIPLTVKVSTDSIIDKKSIGGLLGSLISQEIKVQYRGGINYKFLEYTFTYDVDETDTLKIKL